MYTQDIMYVSVKKVVKKYRKSMAIQQICCQYGACRTTYESPVHNTTRHDGICREADLPDQEADKEDSSNGEHRDE